jgi:hypothetical protein
VEQAFAFDRTVSRLLEMQSQEYVGACLRAISGDNVAANAAGNTIAHRPSQGAEAIDLLLRDLVKGATLSDPQTQWTLRSLWRTYRLGSADEVQHALLAYTGSSTSSGSGEESWGLGAEHRQVMRSADFRVMLADLAECRLRDLATSDPRSSAARDFLFEHFQEDDEYVDFVKLSKTVLSLLYLLD